MECFLNAITLKKNIWFYFILNIVTISNLFAQHITVKDIFLSNPAFPSGDVLSEITGLGSIDSSTLVWTNLFGEIKIFDTNLAKIILQKELDSPITKSIFDSKSNAAIFLCTNGLLEYEINKNGLKQKAKYQISEYEQFNQIAAFFGEARTNIAAISNNSTIYLWQKKEERWSKDSILLDFPSFTSAFISSDSLCLATQQGEIKIVDLSKKKVVIDKKIFEHTTSLISVLNLSFAFS